MQETEVGTITHFYGKVSVGIIKLAAALKVGDTIHVKGAHDDFTQDVESMQIEHTNVPSAQKGDEVGIKINSRVHPNDKVYKVTA
jgi:putative protease